ncbi:MAG: cytochrome c3 family protein [Candidatus Schekmanbacteria bacterium]|nr:cytochrome c3 family protein [Candidatus Schekmanbacteria bacterium]
MRGAAGIHNHKAKFIVCFVIALFFFLSFPGLSESASEPEHPACIDCHDIKAEKGDIPYAHDGMECADCHQDIKFTEDPHSRSKLAPLEICSGCHEKEAKDLNSSIHTGVMKGKDVRPPDCVSCHGNHKIFTMGNKGRDLLRAEIPKACAVCHSDLKFVAVTGGVYSKKVYVEYNNSIHGQSIEKGVMAAAVCTDCHGSHSIKSPVEQDSTVSRVKVPETCGKCHYGILKQYVNSIHYTAAMKGISSSPVCTNCHGIHTISALKSDEKGNGGREIVFNSCARCHGDLRLSKEFTVSAERVTSYMDSYHGLAARQGELTVADCGSCHGVHSVLPSSNPESMVSKNNLAKTCGQCHAGSSENFMKGSIHLMASEAGNSMESRVTLYLKWFYIFLIIATIAGMGAHNLLDFIRKAQKKYRGEIPHAHRSGIYYERMSLSERVQHLMLLTSFIVLVITGFALKFPDSWWSYPFKIIEGGASMRGLVHRIAAAVMTAAALYHVYFIIVTKRGRSFLKGMIPVFKDAKDALMNLMYMALGKGERPKYDRFNYIEKSEYWALVWGTFVMAATGAVLWFENEVMMYLPKLLFDVSEVIHYYEAWLATLAILVWHIYYVIFNPDVYPMNWTWLTGKISREEMEEEHPLELEKIEQETKEVGNE